MPSVPKLPRRSYGMPGNSSDCVTDVGDGFSDWLVLRRLNLRKRENCEGGRVSDRERCRPLPPPPTPSPFDSSPSSSVVDCSKIIGTDMAAEVATAAAAAATVELARLDDDDGPSSNPPKYVSKSANCRLSSSSLLWTLLATCRCLHRLRPTLSPPPPLPPPEPPKSWPSTKYWSLKLFKLPEPDEDREERPLRLPTLNFLPILLIKLTGDCSENRRRCFIAVAPPPTDPPAASFFAVSPVANSDDDELISFFFPYVPTGGLNVRDPYSLYISLSRSDS